MPTTHLLSIRPRVLTEVTTNLIQTSWCDNHHTFSFTLYFERIWLIFSNAYRVKQSFNNVISVEKLPLSSRKMFVQVQSILSQLSVRNQIKCPQIFFLRGDGLTVGIDPSLRPAVIIMTSHVVKSATISELTGLLAHELGHLITKTSNLVLAEYDADRIATRITDTRNVINGLVFLARSIKNHLLIDNQSLTKKQYLKYMSIHYPTLLPRIRALLLVNL